MKYSVGEINNIMCSTKNVIMCNRDVVAIACLSAFSTLYFGCLYNYGYDWGDIGSYAQICYEVYLGSSPTEFVGYGVVWYFLGAMLFHLVGVNYTALMEMIYALMFVSTILLFLTIRRATGLFWLAVVIAVILIVVPPFPASTVRSICLAIFVLPIITLAQAPIERGQVSLVATTIAVGIVAMLRQDIGYLFIATLFLVVVVRSWSTTQTFRAGARRFLSSIGLMLLTLAIVLLLFSWFAVEHGFFAEMWTRYILYYYYLLSSLESVINAIVGLDARSGHNEYLRMMPLSSILSADGGIKIFALLSYSTTMCLIVFGIYTIFRCLRQSINNDYNIINFTIILVVGSQWPIFALFRPDWSHFVTFMQAYFVLAAIAISTVMQPGRMFWAIRIPVIVIVVAQIALFVGYGVQAPGMGWLAQRQGRDAVFDGSVGIHIKVSAMERLEYQAIDQVIRANSRPDESIICVPYCAGYAFMAERRMLFREHYVDDNVAAGQPMWIDNAIALTKKMQIPVIIIQNWAPNGTGASRFVNWAARYMDFVRETYPVAIHLSDTTIWLLKSPAIPPESIAVDGYGPRTTKSETSRPNGDLAVWMLVKGLHVTAAIYLDGKPLVSTLGDNVITAQVPSDFITIPRRYWLQVIDPAFNVSTKPVPFDVLPPNSP